MWIVQGHGYNGWFTYAFDTEAEARACYTLTMPDAEWIELVDPDGVVVMCP